MTQMIKQVSNDSWQGLRWVSSIVSQVEMYH